MPKHARVNHTTAQRIWHAYELKPHLVRTVKLSNDNPRRFVWTKPQSEFLNNLARLYANRG